MSHRMRLAAAALLGASCLLAAADASRFRWRREENKVFGAGERIEYKMRFGTIPSGSAVMEVRPVETIQNRPAYHIVLAARTNKSMDVLHKVREENHSWMDVESLCSLQFMDNTREGSYRREATTSFDHPAGKLKHVYKTSKSEGAAEENIDPFIQDTVSVIYYLRTRELKEGAEFSILTSSQGKIWPVKARVKGIEEVRVPAGKFECYHIQPVLEKKAKRKGELEIWLTADQRRVPVLIRSQLSVGAFDARMSGYTPGTP